MLITLKSDHETLSLGSRLATKFPTGFYLSIEGDLGAGKTTLTRGFLGKYGIKEPIKSPTYSLVEIYQMSGISFFHFDLYRLSSPIEFIESGFDEYFEGSNICIVEWANKLNGFFREPDIIINLEYLGEGRTARIISNTGTGYECLSQADLI